MLQTRSVRRSLLGMREVIDFILIDSDINWIIAGSAIGLGAALCITLVMTIILVRNKMAMKNNQFSKEGKFKFSFTAAIEY